MGVETLDPEKLPHPATRSCVVVACGGLTRQVFAVLTASAVVDIPLKALTPPLFLPERPETAFTLTAKSSVGDRRGGMASNEGCPPSLVTETATLWTWPAVARSRRRVAARCLIRLLTCLRFSASR